MSALNAARLERVTSDHLPACPRCNDLSVPGSEFCGSCGGPLTEKVAYLDRRFKPRRVA